MSTVAKGKFVAELLNNTFWKTSTDSNTLIGIRLYNSQPYGNVYYPYQLLLTFYTPGYTLYADTQQQIGYVGLDGTIIYSNQAWKGQLIDSDTIVWLGQIGGKGVSWTKVSTLPADPQTLTYAEKVKQFENDFTGILHKEYTSAYSTYLPNV